MPFPHRHVTLSNNQSLTSDHKASSQASFVCTICWQPQLPPSSPKFLGTSARIVCHACWKAVLDLSICWVCGEWIVRGDEVVSLGWCFWHRCCFGCLVCGTRMNVYDMLDFNETENETTLGIELEDVPLCHVCEIETMGERKEVVMAKGLEMVSRFDGGLSRDRLGMLERASMTPTKHFRRRLQGRTRSSEDRWHAEKRSTKSSSSSGSSKKSRKATRSSEDKWIAERRQAKSRSGSGSSRKSRGAVRSSECHWDSARMAYSTSPAQESVPHDDLHSLTKHAADVGIGEDGSAEVPEISLSPDSLLTKAIPSEEEQPDIYISVLDPLGEDAAFRPSRTKPLPKWMKLLPSNVHRERERKSEITSAQHSMHSEQAETLRVSSNSESSLVSTSEGEEMGSTSDATVTATTPPMEIPVPKANPRPSITFASRLAEGDHRRSLTGNSVYLTPPEYAPIHGLPARKRTPFPVTKGTQSKGERSSKVLNVISETKVPADHCSLADKVERSPTPDYFQPRLEGFVAGEFISSSLLQALPCSLACTPSSTEFLDRYRPKQSAGSAHSSYRAKEPEPILAKIKRQKVGKEKEEGAAEKTNGKYKVERLGDEDYTIDPRRKDLHRELRNLFGRK